MHKAKSWEYFRDFVAVVGIYFLLLHRHAYTTNKQAKSWEYFREISLPAMGISASHVATHNQAKIVCDFIAAIAFELWLWLHCGRLGAVNCDKFGLLHQQLSNHPCACV